MSVPRKWDKQQVILSFVRNNGFSHLVAKELEVTEETICHYVKAYDLVEFCAEMYKNRHKQMIKKAEGIVAKAMDEDKPWAAKFVLKRVGKDDWSEKHIVESTIRQHEVIKPFKEEQKLLKEEENDLSLE